MNNVIHLPKRATREDVEAFVDFAAEAAVDAGMSLRELIDLCLRWYAHYRRKT